MSYTKINNIIGWLAFGIALVTYTLTMAPTASYWDCGEFIASANELQVPHPPGAPLFLILGRLFAMFAPSPEKVALMLNFLSALSSAFTVLFTTWITTMLARKMVVAKGEQASNPQLVAIMAAGLVAGLTNTFIDSFWFNAVEAEVYASSSFFTAIVVWLMFKWEARADEVGNERWIVLIAYVMGLSIGVHLLNLLAIPALAFIFYFRKYKFTPMGFIATGAISVVILGTVLYGIILKTFDFVWWFEKLFAGIYKNGKLESGMGMAVGTGQTFFIILLLGALGAGIWYAHKRNWLWVNTALVSTLVIYIGFSSYAMIPIRSNDNPSIDENDPENTLAFISYMKREQYGDRPLISGPLYNVQAIGYDRTQAYDLRPDKKTGDLHYVEAGDKIAPKYAPGSKKTLPRMYSGEARHVNTPNYPYSYHNFVRRKGATNEQTGRDLTHTDDRPTGGEDLRFFWEYQLKHMYWRYFMWNFAGREGDVQDLGWESGIATGNLPATLANDPSKNHYYMLPFILGLLGLGWQIKTRGTDAAIVGLLFFFTGIAIILYLNQPPMQPRERDYSFAGSFQTYAIWVGLGVIGLYGFLEKFLKGNAAYVATVLGLIPAILLGAENWDDHDRSGRYAAPDSAYNLLMSLEKNAVLFTNGDNDTFPLWYLQEVEGVRTDVRVLCLSYVNTDWYIDQMYTKVNDSEPLPLSLKRKDYRGQENQAKSVGGRKNLDYSISFDPNSLLANGIITEEDTAYVQSPMRWKVPTRGGGNNRYLELKDILLLNLLENAAKGGWKRPVYFANTVAPSALLRLEDYLRLEGLAYRILPVKRPNVFPKGSPYSDPYHGYIDAERMEHNLMEEFRYRNLDNASVFYDDNTKRMVNNYHLVFYRLANHYLGMAANLETEAEAILANKLETERVNPEENMAKIEANRAQAAAYKAKAKEAVEFVLKSFPYEIATPEYYVIARLGAMLDRIGMIEEADKCYNFVETGVTDVLNHYTTHTQYYSKDTYALGALQELAQHYNNIRGDRAKAEELSLMVRNYMNGLDQMRVKRERKMLGR